MGAFDVIPNIIVPDPNNPVEAAKFRKKWRWEPHEQVIMRGTMTAADQETIGNAATITGKKGDMDYRAGSARLALLQCMIVDWTFASGGRKVEVSPASIKRLPSNYVTPLLEKCDELAVAMTEQEQEDFFTSASEPTLANFAEMSEFLTT